MPLSVLIRRLHVASEGINLPQTATLAERGKSHEVKNCNAAESLSSLCALNLNSGANLT